MITVTTELDRIVGQYRSECRHEMSTYFRLKGTLDAQYRFAFTAGGCAAAINALQFLPADATISVHIEKGITHISGQISVRTGDAISPAQYAAEKIEEIANQAVVISRSCSAKITYTQVWDQTWTR